MIRGIPASIRPPIRHSGEGRNPEGMGNVGRSKTTRGEGLVPRWGGGGAWQNRRCQLAVPSHNSSFSYLGVPVATGMSDCYENRPLRWPVVCDSRHPSVNPAPNSSFRRRPESRGDGKCRAVEDYARRGACPPLGWRRGVAESAVPIGRTKPQLQLFIPWCAGASPASAIAMKTDYRD